MAEASRVSTVAERYANALFELALEGNQLAAVETDLGRFTSLIAVAVRLILNAPAR